SRKLKRLPIGFFRSRSSSRPYRGSLRAISRDADAEPRDGALARPDRDVLATGTPCPCRNSRAKRCECAQAGAPATGNRYVIRRDSPVRSNYDERTESSSGPPTGPENGRVPGSARELYCSRTLGKIVRREGACFGLLFLDRRLCPPPGGECGIRRGGG